MTIESNFHLLELKHYTFLSNFFHSLSTKMETVALGQYDSNVTSKCLAHSLKNQLYCYCSSKETTPFSSPAHLYLLPPSPILHVTLSSLVVPHGGKSFHH